MTEVEGIVYDFDARNGVVAVEIHTPVGANKVVRFPTDEKSWVLGEAVIVKVERPEASAAFVEVQMPESPAGVELPIPIPVAYYVNDTIDRRDPIVTLG